MARHLPRVFIELRDYWSKSIIARGTPTKEETLKELSLPSVGRSRLCLFVIPYKLQSFYQDNVFPIAESYGFVPPTVDDLVSPGDNIIATEMALLDRAEIAVIDISSITPEMSILASKRASRGARRVLLITESGFDLPTNLKDIPRVERTRNVFSNYETFLRKLDEQFRILSEYHMPHLDTEPSRLLEIGEHRAAFISAMTFLESSLRRPSWRVI